MHTRPNNLNKRFVNLADQTRKKQRRVIYAILKIIQTIGLTFDEFSFLMDYAVNDVVHHTHTSPHVAHVWKWQVRVKWQHRTPSEHVEQ